MKEATTGTSKTSFTYMSNHLVETVVVDGKITTYSYNENQQLTSVKQKNGVIIKYTHDKVGNAGIYTKSQWDVSALALAIVFNCGRPEVHSSGQYGHYNDA